MKYVPIVVGALLGLLFAASGLTFLLHVVQMPPMPEGTPAAMFMGAFIPTGYMTMVKVFETIGGILVAIPRTRNWGLLVLGPIIINILAFSFLVMKGPISNAVPGIVVSALAAYLLWVGRKSFAGLLN